MPNRRDFLKAVVAGAAGTYVMSRGGTDTVAAASQAQPARRQVMVGGRRVRVIDVHAHCVIPVEEIVKGTPLAKMGGGAGTEHPRPAASAAHGSARRRCPGAEHQWLLVVRGRSRPRTPDRSGAERGTGEVGGGTPRSLCRVGLGCLAVSRSGGRSAPGRGQAAGPSRSLNRRARERRGSLAPEVRPVLGEGRGARGSGLHAPRRREQYRQRGRARAGAAISATSSAIHSKRPTSCRD